VIGNARLSKPLSKSPIGPRGAGPARIWIQESGGPMKSDSRTDGLPIAGSRQGVRFPAFPCAPNEVHLRTCPVRWGRFRSYLRHWRWIAVTD